MHDRVVSEPDVVTPMSAVIRADVRIRVAHLPRPHAFLESVAHLRESLARFRRREWRARIVLVPRALEIGAADRVRVHRRTSCVLCSLALPVNALLCVALRV